MDENVSDTAPGCVLFPEYATLYDLIAPEVEGLTDAQLDFSSERWAWAAWSLRFQLSHIAYATYSWLLVRWGQTLFPHGEHGIADVQGLTASDFAHRLDARRYWALADLLQQLHGAIGLAQRVLVERTVAFLRSQSLLRDYPEHWRLMIQAHPTGVTRADVPDKLIMSLEATFRHVYFEVITHLFNMQRLKRAQGLPTVVEVPRVGYWMLDGWDRSEAFS